MKVLILIISSDNNQAYEKHHKIWRCYMNSNPHIDAYFIKYHHGEVGIQGDTLYFNGIESLENIIFKTLDAFEYFRNKPYDFIIRSNLSSLWNYNALLKYLESLPRENVYSGIIGNHNNLIPFISGSGFIMTPDVVNLLLNNRSQPENVKIIDDVDIGYTLEKLGVPRLHGSRQDFYSKNMVDKYIYDHSIYHYRFKWHDPSNRNEEGDCMLKIMENF